MQRLGSLFPFSVLFRLPLCLYLSGFLFSSQVSVVVSGLSFSEWQSVYGSMCLFVIIWLCVCVSFCIWLFSFWLSFSLAVSLFGLLVCWLAGSLLILCACECFYHSSFPPLFLYSTASAQSLSASIFLYQSFCVNSLPGLNTLLVSSLCVNSQSLPEIQTESHDT